MKNVNCVIGLGLTLFAVGCGGGKDGSTPITDKLANNGGNSRTEVTGPSFRLVGVYPFDDAIETGLLRGYMGYDINKPLGMHEDPYYQIRKGIASDAAKGSLRFRVENMRIEQARGGNGSILAFQISSEDFAKAADPYKDKRMQISVETETWVYSANYQFVSDLSQAMKNGKAECWFPENSDHTNYVTLEVVRPANWKEVGYAGETWNIRFAPRRMACRIAGN